LSPKDVRDVDRVGLLTALGPTVATDTLPVTVVIREQEVMAAEAEKASSMKILPTVVILKIKVIRNVTVLIPRRP
jgi:hypothetical protein